MSSNEMAVQYNYKTGRIQLRLAKTLDILGVSAIFWVKQTGSGAIDQQQTLLGAFFPAAEAQIKQNPEANKFSPWATFHPMVKKVQTQHCRGLQLTNCTEHL